MSVTAANNIVAISGLTLDFPTYRGRVHALSDVTLAVREGEITGLVGESGCGKSVASMSIIRLLPPGSTEVMSGTIRLRGHDISRASEREMEGVRGKLVSMVFQEPMSALNPTIRIGRQITQVIRRHETVSLAEATSRAEALLTEMQVPDASRIMRNYPFELSGGMRQRVLLAMAFSCNPAMLIADEPTTALDVTVQAQVLMLLKERARQRGTSVLFITHDLAVVAQLCDSVYVMYAGHIVEEGPTRAVLRHPAHPYTRALLRSLPELGHPKQALAAISGNVPDLAHPPAGCAFRPRCAAAHDACRAVPDLFPAPDDAGHRAACWLLPEGASAESAPPAGLDADRHRTASEPAATPLLALEDVAVRFPVGFDWRGRPLGHVHALNGVDLTLRRGETLGIVGESGCGKTTLGQIIMRLLAPSRGRVVFDGIDLDTVDATRLREIRRRFQIVFQDPQSSLDPRMTVWRAITEPLAVAERHANSWLRDKARVLAEEVGLRSDQLERYQHEFSGGQRQRIAIARALVVDPRILILDDATASVDATTESRIREGLREAMRNRTTIIIAHRLSTIALADEIVVLDDGRIVFHGTQAEAHANEVYREIEDHGMLERIFVEDVA